MGKRGATIGIVANPASGRDIRRLVAQASVFPTSEKANMVRRILAACGELGVDRALLSIDLGGISASLVRSLNRGQWSTRGRSSTRGTWPEVQFCEDVALTDSAEDTTNAVHAMIRAGADAIVCLGGDGTARVVADACGDTPVLALSTGTNNAFPQVREATVAGMAVALIATGAVDPERGTTRSKVLEVRAGDRRELAVVDVCTTSDQHVGSRALWEPDALGELYCAFAEPDGIGLSSVPGLIHPVSRLDPRGVAVRFAPADTAGTVLSAPVAPGLVRSVGVHECWSISPGEAFELGREAGVIAVDGERELELPGQLSATVVLRTDGPRCVDVSAVLAEAGGKGLLRREPPVRQRDHQEVRTR